MGLTADHRIASATPARWREISAALASAFHADPVFSWLIPDPAARTRALRRFFEIETRHVVLPYRMTVTATSGTDTLGAALVLPPAHWRTPLRVQARHAPAFLNVFARRLGLALGVLTALERRHPRAPHFYLPYVGVRPDAQNQGLGGALLAPLLDRCDRQGLPAYLEASSPDNARLYRRLGFSGIEIVRPLGAPPIELMIRQPVGRR
jgi:GNAT superfamily N-acetyltransferase